MKKLFFYYSTIGLFLNSWFNVSVLAQNQADRLKNIEATYPIVDKIFKDFATQNHFPGLVYGLVIDGKLTYVNSIGYTNLEKKTPVSSKSAFRIASMTKSLTAMAILKLRDEGKLNLDDPTYLYIPEMKNQPYPSADAPDVSIRHLLTHAAGFPEDNPWGDRQLAISDEALIQFIKKGISYSNNPGIAYEYSNLGFAMLGLIIKKISGESYQKYINRTILTPLGMSNTYWEYAEVPENQLALGYRWLDNQWLKEDLLHDGAYGAMGGLITTMEDFSKYVALHQSAWTSNNTFANSPLKASSLREMQMPWNVPSLSPQYKYANGRVCPMISSYGYGLRWTKDCENRVMVGHSGGLPGFGSNWRIMPDYGIGIISFANVTYASAGQVNITVLDTLINLAKLKPKPIAISPILNQRKNELLKLLPDWTNASNSGIFAENFFSDYIPDLLKKEANAIFNKAGKILQVKDIVPENNLRGTFIIECEKSAIEIYFTLSPEKIPLIQEYHIKEIAKSKPSSQK